MPVERLTAILDAAYQCFTRHGTRRTTMDDIAHQAGLSRPGLEADLADPAATRKRLRRGIEIFTAGMGTQ